MNDLDLQSVGVSPQAMAEAMRRAAATTPEQDPHTYAPPGSLLDWVSSLLPDWLSGRSAVMRKRQQYEDIDRMLDEANR